MDDRDLRRTAQEGGSETPLLRVHCAFGRDGRLHESARLRAADSEPDPAPQPLLALMTAQDRERLLAAVRKTAPREVHGPIEATLQGAGTRGAKIVWHLRGEDDRVLVTGELQVADRDDETDERLRFFEKVGLPAFVLDGRLIIRAANRQARLTFAEVGTDLIGTSWTALVEGEGDRGRVDAALAEAQAAGRSHCTFETGASDDRDGARWSITACGGATADGRTRTFYAVGVETTETRRLDPETVDTLEARMAVETGERVAAFTRQVLNNAAHGLRTPLTPIKASIHILRNRLDTLFDETSNLAIETLEIQTRRLADLVDDILDVSALENGDLRMWADEADLGKIVRQEVDRYSDRARRTGVDLRLRVQDRLTVEADRARIARVIRHLLDNAFEHAPQGGNVRVIAAEEDGHAIVRVHNSGPPFIEHAEGLYQAFAKGPAPREPAARGAGLGLVFCKGVIESLGGEIWHDLGLQGQGAEIAFSLPITLARRPQGGAGGDTAPGGLEGRTLIGGVEDGLSDLAEDGLEAGPYTPT